MKCFIPLLAMASSAWPFALALTDLQAPLLLGYFQPRVTHAMFRRSNRELAVLGRMLRLAYENGKLMRLPLIHKLKEAAPRSGFFERSQFEADKRHLRPDLQVAVSIAYAFGWRMQSEVLTLTREQVNLAACTIRLDPGTTKNDDGRIVYLTPELVEMLQAQDERVQLLEITTGRKVPHLFPYLSGEHEGERIQDFRKA